MNKQQLIESRRGWVIWGLAFAFIVLIIIITANPYKAGYSQGVNDTLNNYSCSEKMFTGEIIDAPIKYINNCKKEKSSSGSFYVTGLNCSNGLCHYDNAVFIQGLGICYKQVNRDYHCPV